MRRSSNLWGSLIVVASLVGPVSGQEDQSPELQALLARLEAYQQEAGVPPDIRYFYDELTPNSLSRVEQDVLRIRLADMQQPQIQLDDLVGLLSAVRDSIRSFYCEYSVETTGEMQGYVFAFGGARLFMEVPSGGGLRVSAFDGSLFRSVSYSSAQRDPSSAQATIQKDGAFSSFYLPNMPLCRAMLFNTAMTDSVSPIADLPVYLNPDITHVYEMTEDIRGASCILLSSGGADIYVDPKRDFAVRRLDNFEIIWGEPDGLGFKTIGGRWLTHRTELSQFVDYGNGLWLPHDIEFTTYRPRSTGERNSRQNRHRISVKKLDVNPDLEQSFFEDIIPDGAMVNDATQRLVYRNGGNPSINELVGEAVQAKRARTRLIALNIVAIAILVIVSAYKRRVGSSHS